VDEQVSPSDIVVVTMGRLQGRYFGEHVATALSHALADVGARAEHRTSEGFLKDGRTVVVTTPHSFKGYEAELVYVPGVDQFHEGSAPLAAPLYVALTRARSVLVASGIEASGPGQQIVVAMRQVGDLAGTAPCVDDRQSLSRGGVKEHLQALLGAEHKTWLDELAASYELTIDVMTAPTGEIIAEPLFVARSETARVAFYRPDDAPLRPERFRIEDAGFTVGLVGEPLTTGAPP
jgi:superfamily I DNA/RNA helicase